MAQYASVLVESIFIFDPCKVLKNKMNERLVKMNNLIKFSSDKKSKYLVCFKENDRIEIVLRY